MRISKIISFCYLVLFCYSSFSSEVSQTLLKACETQQLKDHKSIQGHTFNEDDFKEYCICETEFFTENATESQLMILNKKSSENSKWLGQLRIKAMEKCLTKTPKKTS